MRVLLIDVNCKYSSTGKIVYDLYTGIREAGHEAAVCYGRGEKIGEQNIYKFGLDWETYMHALLARITGLNGCFSFFSTRRLIKYIEKYKPDVIHIHELHAYFANLHSLIEYIKKKHIKVVWTFHCEYMYTGKCGYAYECSKWQTECGKCPTIKDYPKSMFFDMTQYMFNQKKSLLMDLDMIVVTPSQWLADRVKMSFLKNKPINVIHNGINTDIFRMVDATDLRKELKISDEDKVVLSVAPDIMSERKGGREILKIAESMKQENVKFVLVGATDVEQQHPDNVKIIGKLTNQKELAEYYSMADVFLICSKRENFPTTCIEALCCGTPVVGYDTGGTAETASGKVGCFVKYGDIENIILAIKSFVVEEEKDVSEECALYGKLRYSKQAMYEKYLALYQE